MGSINFQLQAEAEPSCSADLDVQTEPDTVPYLLSLKGPEQEHLSSLGPRVYSTIIEINLSTITVFLRGDCWGKRLVI